MDSPCREAPKYTAEVERLVEYAFPEEFHGRIILETWDSPEPDMMENLLAIDADALREGKQGAFSIVSITQGDKMNANIEVVFHNKNNN